MPWIPLLLKYWQIGAIAALVAFGAFELHERDAANEAKGKAEERSRVADSTLAVVRAQKPKADTIYRRDTVHLTQTIARTTTLRDTLLVHLTDTLRVKEFVAASDSTIHACTEVANSCAANLRLRDQEIAALTTKLAAAPVLADQRHWYSDRFSAGPYAGIDQHGKFSYGVSGQLALFRFP